MRVLENRTGKGYEIVCYYPKKNGQYTDETGNTSKVLQTEDVSEVAEWFARRSWASPYGDSDYANPTVFYNGKRWPEPIGKDI